MQGDLSSNIHRYQWLQAMSLFFSVPVIVLFWRANGLNDFDIYILQAIFAIAVVILEVPTGVVADLFGKRTSLLLGKSLSFVGWTTYAMGHNFTHFLASEVILAAGFSFVSGAESALLYDSLRAMGRQNEYKKIEGRATAIQLLAMAAAGMIGGFVGAHSLRATMWMSAAGPGMAIFIALGLIEAQPRAAAPQALTGISSRLVHAYREYREITGNALRFLRKHRLVRWYVVFSAVLTSSGAWLLWMYQPYMEFTGLPVAMFGIAFSLFNLCAAVSSHYAHSIDNRLGNSRTLALMAFFQTLPLFLMAALRVPASFLFILGHQTVRGINRAILSDRLLRYVYADKRATVLSLTSLAGRLFFAMTGPVVGWFSGRFGLMPALLLQGCALLFVFAWLFTWYRRIPRKYFSVKASVLDKQ